MESRRVRRRCWKARWSGMHSGFAPTPEVDLNELERWRAGSVDFLSINVGYDVYPWEDTIRNLAAFRHWLALRPQ